MAVIGYGFSHTALTENQIRELCAEASEQIRPDGKRLLVIVPDSTRSCPMPVLFRILYALLAPRVKALDFLIALGTHPPMSETAICRHFGISSEEKKSAFPKAQFFNHAWNDPSQLREIGTISPSEMALLSEGRISQAVPITINQKVLEYDRVILLGPTFPHEVVGFSGGNKYFFPGVAGKEIIDIFHWLGALITNPVINGVKDTPVRRVIDRASSFIQVEKYAMSLVVQGESVYGFFFGSPEEAFSKAADLSSQIHIIYKEKPFQKVLSCAPAMYDELWTAGKCMYKLEPVVADGGELVIYAPHLNEISVTHGDILKRIGYHVRDYFTSQMERFKDVPLGVMAHSTHVKGIGTYENGIESPRIRVVLATGIPEAVCRQINLDYMDPRTIRPEEWMDQEEKGILYVPKAGEMLYRLIKKQAI